MKKNNYLRTSKRAFTPLALGLLGATAAHAQTASVSEDTSSRLVWADFDGDGTTDLYSAADGRQDVLLRNLGAGQFADATAEFGLATYASRLVRAADFDRDGDVDLLQVGQDGRTRLLESVDGVFQPSAKFTAGLESATRADWTDFDGDGWLDLWVEQASGQPALFRSVDGLAFEELALELPEAKAAMTAAVGAEESAAGTSRAPSEISTADTSDTSRSGPGGRVPLDVSTAGLDGTVEASTSNPTIDDVAPIIGISCATSIANETGGGCITAATTGGVVGRLLAQSSRLFVAANGNVGINTLNPNVGFHVNNRNSRFNGNILMNDDLDSIQFPTVSGASNPMIQMFSGGDGQRGSHGPGPLACQSRLGPGLRGRGDAFVFQTSSSSNPTLAIDMGNGVGIGTNAPATDLHIRRLGDAELLLEADTNNSGEGDQPLVRFSQDGGQVQSRIGMVDSANAFVIENQFTGSDMQLRVVDASVAGQQRSFVFQNTSTNGAVNDTEARLTELGNWEIDGVVSSPAADLAEYYDIEGEMEPGDIVMFVGDTLRLTRADQTAEPSLIGIVSSRPGLTLGLSYTDETSTGVAPTDITDANRLIGDEPELWIDRTVLHEINVNGRAPLALAGRVPVKVCDENGPIRPGDALTLSSTPGYAMRSIEPGPIVGTALQSWNAGQGRIVAIAQLGAQR